MIPSTDVFLSHVAAHAGGSLAQVDFAARAVLAEIGGRLSASERALVTEELPPALAATLAEPHYLARPVEDALCARGLGLGPARELIASVCHALAESLSHEALAAVRAAAPSPIAGFLAADEVELGRPAGYGSSLADGRPGSRHPISEGRDMPLPRRR
ncbi:MAG TPA: DUF2267 domain-containing protein [Kofleriaceae bacterium]|nr:DUF2267 domain-containing protein [Kofleriaceae bacterium]